MFRYEDLYLLGHNEFSLLKVNRPFVGTCCLHLQGQSSSACFPLHAGFLLGLVGQENGGDMFLRNVS
jgi:hypothetical protein